jgi:hypothetical protein
MAQIEKGVILTIEGPVDRNGDNTRARVQPQAKPGLVSRPLTIPWWLRGKMGNLTKGTEVVFTLFEDQTGVILSRMDGDWEGTIPGPVNITGKITVSDIETEEVSSFNSHVHGGVTSGTSKTSGPE